MEADTYDISDAVEITVLKHRELRVARRRQPHGVSFWVHVVLRPEASSIRFHSTRSPKKAYIIRDNPRCSSHIASVLAILYGAAASFSQSRTKT